MSVTGCGGRQLYIEIVMSSGVTSITEKPFFSTGASVCSMAIFADGPLSTDR